MNLQHQSSLAKKKNIQTYSKQNNTPNLSDAQPETNLKPPEMNQHNISNANMNKTTYYNIKSKLVPRKTYKTQRTLRPA